MRIDRTNSQIPATFQDQLRRVIAFSEQNDRWIMTFLLGLVLVAGVLYSAYLGSAIRYLPDEMEYTTLAENLVVRGRYSLDGVNPSVFRPPGYPLFLAVLRLFGANIVFFRLVNFALLSGVLVLVHKILMEHSSRLASTLGPILVVVYPVFFYTAGTLYPQTLASFLFILSIYLLNKHSPRKWDYFVAGATLGFLVLTVPMFAFVLIVLIGWAILMGKGGQVKGAMFTLVLALLVIGVWTARNYIVFDRFVFISSNSGENLLVGNSENTTPNAGTNADISVYRAKTVEMDEIERDQFYLDSAIEYIRKHPWTSLKLYVMKVINYFNYRNELVTQSEASSMKDLLVFLSYVPLLAVFLMRWLLVKWVWPAPFEVLLSLLYILSAFFSAIFFTRIRFRVPFDLLLIMVVAIFVAQAIRIYKVRLFPISQT